LSLPFPYTCGLLDGKAAHTSAVTSQFFGKEFINFSDEIMHHSMHTITLHLHTFSSFCFVLESKPSLYVSNIRRKVLQISKCDLSSNQKLFASFQTKFKRKQKRKRKKIGKMLKGRGAALWPETGSGPQPVLPLFPNRYRFLASCH
jgi:hypothetical protein